MTSLTLASTLPDTRWVTRIAPSPTGYLHLGTARTAYFNWLAARATGGSFLLRIDDTDASRNNDAFVDIIYQAMDYLKLDYDQSFKQSDRAARYRQVADRLVDRGRARRQDGAIFLNHPLPGDAQVRDLAVGQIKATALDFDTVQSMVLVKSDGMATYHFANVVDDLDHGVNLVLRGADHISNTLRQVAVYLALDAMPPLYAHVGLLHDLATGKKLSKSTGAPSLLDYRDSGVDPDAMCNFLLRLGWGPKVDDRSAVVLPRHKALGLFLDGGKLRAAASKVDFAALAKLDRRYKAAKSAGPSV